MAGDACQIVLFYLWHCHKQSLGGGCIKDWACQSAGFRVIRQEQLDIFKYVLLHTGHMWNIIKYMSSLIEVTKQ